ncbi:blast:Rho GTPase-activating protein 6 [Drosophila guanche]|uniref:Blast:Rho GTPase-activating protein 6 n=1 Tax=Drosophila guanche TaxID=7266 RepID=A0A3B0KT62_DROGU|nr:blast:Rho GTPase-activating protein 6 [Drosophila guanche]
MEEQIKPEQHLSTLRRPVAVIKKRSGPLDDAIDMLSRPGKDLSILNASNPSDEHCGPTNMASKNLGRASPGSRRRRCSTKDKEKKRERWLLTRKTWRYMTEAGRKLLPEGAQSESDISLIEAQFQRACASEPCFILWRRKTSYPGAIHNSKRRLKVISRHTSGSRCGADTTDQHINADQTIELLQSYLKIRDAYKTTTLLGTKTVRPDQTSSPSAHRPIGNRNDNILKTDYCEKSLEKELLSRLKLLSETPLLDHIVGVKLHVDNLRQDILEDKVLLRQIYNSLKKQQLHRMLHSTEPSKHNIGRASSLSSILKLNSYQNSYKKCFSSGVKKIVDCQRLDNRIHQKPTSFDNCDIRTNLGVAPDKHSLEPRIAPIATDLWTKKGKTKNEEIERSFNTCGTQTTFIQLSELKRMAKEFEKTWQQCKDNSNPSALGDELLEKHGTLTDRRKSSIDNEDISQSVSNTIKRYLRMARKKTVNDADASRFKSINYDKNLRNIKAKGEINPPGMDEGLSKAVQTLEAWPLIALEYVRGNECFRILQNAHIEWKKAEDERTRKNVEWEKARKKNIEEHFQTARNSNTYKEGTTYSTCISAPTSPNSYTRLEKTIKTSTGLLTSSSQFLSNIWHGHSDPGSTTNLFTLNDKQGNMNHENINLRNETSNMQKSKSLSNVGQFVTKKLLRSRSKSQNKPPLQQELSTAYQKWFPLGNCLWISENNEKFQIVETLLMNLSKTETDFLKHFVLEKIKELNIGSNLDLDLERKSHKRRNLPKKKSLTTSFFDIGRKSEHKMSEVLFGTSLECCLSRSRDSKGSDIVQTRTRSKHSLMSVFQGTGNGPESHIKLNESVRSCESLPTKSMDCGYIETSERFRDSLSYLNKPSSSMSHYDMEHNELDFDTTLHTPSHLNVPIFIINCMDYLEDNGLEKIGIFRVSTSRKRVKQLREEFDKNSHMRIPHETCPHDVATLLKEFLRDLPEPLLCSRLYTTFLETQKIRNRRLQLEGISHLIKLLPISHRDTLYVLLRFLAKVAAHSDDIFDSDGNIEINGNKMDSSNLSTVFAPNILRGLDQASARDKEQDHMNDAINVVRTMIDHYEEIFKISADFLDVIYSHMLDACPDILYGLISTKINGSQWILNHSDESSIVQNSDAASSADEVFVSRHAKRYGSVGQYDNEFDKRKSENPVDDEGLRSYPKLACNDAHKDERKDETLKVFSASLQISLPEQSLQYKESVRDKDSETVGNWPSEPRLPASISNIGCATLSAKAAEFEKNATCNNLPSYETQDTELRKKPLYKRQHLISSSRKKNKM